jgi:hypothetical protein
MPGHFLSHRRSVHRRLVESLKATNKRYVVQDTEMRGFMVRVSATGKKVYNLYYRTSADV